MPVLVLAFLIGVVAGLRALTPAAAVSWAARLGWLNLEGTPLGFLRYTVSSILFTVLALGELVNDKLPKTPSRKAPASLGARLTKAFGSKDLPVALLEDLVAIGSAFLSVSQLE